MEPRSIEAVKARLRANHGEIVHSIDAAQAGNPLAAEPDPGRRVARLQSKARLTQREAEALDATIRTLSETPAREGVAPAVGAAGAEKVWGDTVDFVNVSFLEKGARIARAVGRVSFRNESPVGTGFLIGNGLFLTNHYVIPSAEFAQQLALDFDYELDLVGNRRSVTRFLLDPGVFVTDPDTQDGLDYTIIAVGAQLQGTLPIEMFGWSGLSGAGDKHMLGEFANIVQHPNGRFKEVVLRENRLVGRYDTALHYVADTEPGSSGSPVFNSEWRPIALHHWGGPWREVFGDDGTPTRVDINEGIRISAIVQDLRR
ncbi:MAG: DNA/RNA endonuclease, partial [Sphingomonas taxi]